MLKYMFPSEGIDFLKNLASNNNRDWFQANKETFESKVKAPMIAIIEEVNAGLMEFAPEHVTDPKKALYRIYRDTRFSADKTPYKTHIAGVFPRRGMDKHSSGGYYFHVSPQGVSLAAGLYMPTPDQLRLVRLYFAEHHETFLAASRGAEKLMGKLHGESSVRMPKGFPADHPAADLLKMKRWIHWAELDVEMATSRKFAAEVTKRFRAAAPVVQLLNAVALKAAANTHG